MFELRRSAGEAIDGAYMSPMASSGHRRPQHRAPHFTWRVTTEPDTAADILLRRYCDEELVLTIYRMLRLACGYTNSWQSELKERFGYVNPERGASSHIKLTRRLQGFDEFMNLVIDDAVEVVQITKTNDKETRRPLGTNNDHYTLTLCEYR